jgi:hypothetical protein
MATATLPPFGELTPGTPDAYYEASLDLHGREVALDLTLEAGDADEAQLGAVRRMIETLAALDGRNRELLREDYRSADGDTVSCYLDFHEPELAALAAERGLEDSEPLEQLLAVLELVRVGFYPEQPEAFATFDYSIGEELSNHLIVVNLHADGTLAYMTLES